MKFYRTYSRSFRAVLFVRAFAECFLFGVSLIVWFWFMGLFFSSEGWGSDWGGNRAGKWKWKRRFFAFSPVSAGIFIAKKRPRISEMWKWQTRLLRNHRGRKLKSENSIRCE
jgi:hypothetical protein